MTIMSVKLGIKRKTNAQPTLLGSLRVKILYSHTSSFSLPPLPLFVEASSATSSPTPSKFLSALLKYCHICTTQLIYLFKVRNSVFQHIHRIIQLLPQLIRMISSFQNKTPYLSAITLHLSPTVLSPSDKKAPISTSYLKRFTYSGHFI